MIDVLLVSAGAFTGLLAGLSGVGSGCRSAAALCAI